jgi:hypothetical protein
VSSYGLILKTAVKAALKASRLIRASPISEPEHGPERVPRVAKSFAYAAPVGIGASVEADPVYEANTHAGF